MKISFLDEKFIGRIERSPREKDLLRQAIGKDEKSILDATAGLCRDALRMAYWGHTVHACERDKLLGEFLASAYEEAKLNEFYSPWIDRLKIVPASTEDFLKKNPDSKFDLIVIDSMFPAEKRKGLPKKDLQDLKSLVKDDQDNAEPLLRFCLNFSWKMKPKKILVKRPLKAPKFKDLNISHSYKGRSHRWDLYLP